MTDQKHYPMPAMTEQDRFRLIAHARERAASRVWDQDHLLARVALAALTAEPFAHIKQQLVEADRWDSVDPEVILHPNTTDGWHSSYTTTYTAPPVPALKPVVKPETECIGWVKEAIHEHDEKWLNAIRAAGYEVKSET